MEYNSEEFLKLQKEVKRSKSYSIKELKIIIEHLSLLSEKEQIEYIKSLDTNYADGLLEDYYRLYSKYENGLVIIWTNNLYYACVNRAETFLEGVAVMEKLLSERGRDVPLLGQEAVSLANSFMHPKIGEKNLVKAEYYSRFAIEIMENHTDEYQWLNRKIGEAYENLHITYFDMEKYKDSLSFYEKSKQYGYDPIDYLYDECLKKSLETKNEKSEGCYIATCVYGSYNCPPVWTLRRFRDDILSKNLFGRIFINLYYAISPSVVRLFGNQIWFHKLFKPLLNKLVKKLQSNGVCSTPYDD